MNQNSNQISLAANANDIALFKKRRLTKQKASNEELVRHFWLAPEEAYFNQFTIAPVTGRTSKTLECDRWKKCGIPFRKVGGRILYKKSDVINFLESHALVTSTSQYSKEVCND